MSAGTATIELLPDLPIYTADQDVLVRMSFVDTLGVPLDAGEVTLTVVRPDGVQDEYTLSGGGISHPSTGVYERTVTMTMPADWIFHVQGSTVVAAAQVSATVDDSPLFDDTPPLPVPGAGNEGKIARVTGGVYVPYGGGADEQPLVWRVGTGWVGQALNLAAAAAVSGLLAISHIAPGSNGQVLTTTGGVATWGAPVMTPGGGTGEVQYNNGGVLDGASAIKVAGSETALAFGSSAGASAGLLRFVHAPGVALVSGRNQANSADAAIVQWGAGANDRLTIGDTAVAATVLNVATGGSYTLQVNGIAEYVCDATALTMNGNNIVMGAGFLSLGATAPAASGLVRIEHGAAFLVGRNQTNSADALLLRWGSGANDRLSVGSTAVAEMLLNVATGASYLVQVNGVTEYAFNATSADWAQNGLDNLAYASFGAGTKPVSTFLRLGYIAQASGGVGAMSARVEGDTAEGFLIRWNAEVDTLKFGDFNRTAEIRHHIKTGGVHSFYVNNTLEYSLSSTAADFKDNALQFGTNAASAGLIRVPHNVTVAAGRNSADSADATLLSWGTATDTLTLGAVAVAFQKFNVTTGGTYAFRVNAADEYVFDASQLNWKGNNSVGAGFYSGTGNVATTGFLRAPNAVTIHRRNAANTQDLSALNLSDDLTIGDLVNGGNVNYDVASGQVHTFRVAGTDTFNIDANRAFLRNTASAPSSNPANGVFLWSASAQSLRSRSSAGVETHLTPLNGGTTTGTTKQIVRRENRLQTTTVSAGVIDAFTLPDNTVAEVHAIVVVRNTTSAEQNTYFIRQGVRRRGGGATLIGTIAKDAFEENAAYDASFTVSSNDVQVQVQPSAAGSQTNEWWVLWEIILLTP